MNLELNDVISFNATDYATFYFGFYAIFLDSEFVRTVVHNRKNKYYVFVNLQITENIYLIARCPELNRKEIESYVMSLAKFYGVPTSFPIGERNGGRR